MPVRDSTLQLAIERCANEPIHLVESIQPHGALLVVDGSGVVRRVSANVPADWGIDPLGHRFDDIGMRLEAALESDEGAPRAFQLGDRQGVAVMRRAGGSQLWEMFSEPTHGPDSASMGEPSRRLAGALRSLHGLGSVQELLLQAAPTLMQLTGFDRVMVYRFDSDWNGRVVSEARQPGMESFLGLHFPASDIPPQARALYTRSWVRSIADVDAAPVALLPYTQPGSEHATDLSQASLRSVSTVHLQYLRNMGVVASMSASLIVGDRLWGLVACHHRTARVVSPHVRSAVELLAQNVSMQLALRLDRDRLEVVEGGQRRLIGLMDRVAELPQLVDGLAGDVPNVLGLLPADGAVVRYGGERGSLGLAPSASSVERWLLPWLVEHHKQGVRTVATDRLPEVIPDWPETTLAAGVLAVSMTADPHDWTIWFRREVAETVTWGGAPSKRVDPESGALQPRASFDHWKEIVRGRSHSWSEGERQIARRYQRLVVDHQLRLARRLAATNQALARQHTAVDSFAYVVSHDLREPLRGVQTYASFMLEDLGDEESPLRENIDRILTQTKRMDAQLRGLLAYSRASNGAVSRTDLSLSAVVRDVWALHGPAAQERGATLDLEVSSEVSADPSVVQEVLANLIENAIKFGPDRGGVVRVGQVPAGIVPPRAPSSLHPREPVFFVADHGDGIAETHLEMVFEVFKRLDPSRPGTGCGLPIARAMAARHGGLVWADSRVGEGTTFYFTLGQTEAQ